MRRWGPRPRLGLEPAPMDWARDRGLFADRSPWRDATPRKAAQADQVTSAAEVSGYLVGSPAFKAGGRGDPTTAGSIPVHLRQSSDARAAGPATARAVARAPSAWRWRCASVRS